MLRFFIVIMMCLLPSLQSNAQAQQQFVDLFNNLLSRSLSFDKLQTLSVIELSPDSPSHLSQDEAELFQYLFGQTSPKKYLNISNIRFLDRAYYKLIDKLNATSNHQLDYVFVLDQKSLKSESTEHYTLVDNNDYGWCNSIEPKWLEQRQGTTGCKITEAVPVCKIDMKNQSLDRLITKIKRECGSAKLVHITNFSHKRSNNSLNFMDDLPVNTVYFEGPGTLEFDLAPKQAAMILSGNKKLYLKNTTLLSSNNQGIGIHVKNGELRLQGTHIEGFNYGVISEKDTRFYAWHDRRGYQRGANNQIEELRNYTRIHANHTGVMLYQTKPAVFVNTQIQAKTRAIATYDSQIKTDENVISLNQSDWVRHTLWLNDNKRFIKLDANGTTANQTNWDCVIDAKTGLTWKAQEFSSHFTFKEAEKQAKATKLCGLDNWRLPTVEELYWLAERSKIRPAIETKFFPQTYFNNNDDYWSNTPVKGDSNKRWTVNFRHGFDNHQAENTKQRLRLVSGDNPFSLKTENKRFITTGQCIKDTLTQMTWLVSENLPHYWWYQQKEKLAYITKANKDKLCGFSDWRLPQAKSLYLLANRKEESSQILAPNNYWSKWPNKAMFYMGSLSFPLGNHTKNNVFFLSNSAKLILVRGKRINFLEVKP